METDVSECNQVKKYEGFYIGRYEAGVSTLNEETGNFEDSVTFNNNASLRTEVAVQTGINGWAWQNYDYIARQEGTLVTSGSNKVSGNVVLKANSIPYYHADYYTAVEMTKRMYENHKSVISGLVTGTQWDMVMKFMQSSGADVINSNWGNYDDVSLKNLRGYYAEVTAQGATNSFKSTSEISGTNAGLNSRVILTTGSTQQVKKQNLYDIAGNLWECTTEASYLSGVNYNNDVTLNSYMLRGGSFMDAYANRPTAFRANNYAVNTSSIQGFRTILYFK